MRRVVALSALLLALSACKSDETPKPWNQDRFSTAVDIISEDDPRWNCRTMGNKTCGPVNVTDIEMGS